MPWSSDFAYAVGLIVSDGCLSKDGRHIDFTSKDLEQVENFKKALNLNNKIGLKDSGSNLTKKYFRIQFGDVRFYRFLLSIGLMPNKSKNLKEVLIPANYFVDFLRGYFDGDGYTYSYYDRRWKSSFMLYTGFVSASEKYLEWIKTRIKELCGIEGRIKSSNRAFQLVYAKYASIKLLERLYKGQGEIYLKRKKFKIDNALDIIKNMPRC